MHFEENKSALEIAEILNVNRNTINEDIKFWFGQFQNQSKELEIEAKMKKQFHRMEIQRERYFDYLEEVKSITDKIKLEKLISELDNRLFQFYSKVFYSGKSNVLSLNLENDDDKEFREVVKELILSNKDSGSSYIFSYDSLELEFIKKTKCSVSDFSMIFEQMVNCGLEYCQQKSESSDEKDFDYNLLEFAKLRSYFTDKEIEKL